MANINATFNLKGRSGSRYVFHVHTMDGEHLDASGIYVYTKRELNTISQKYEHKIIYIENSDSFSGHFCDPDAVECIDAKGGNCVCIKQIKNANDRERIEYDLLDNYDAVCNEKKSLKKMSQV